MKTKNKFIKLLLPMLLFFACCQTSQAQGYDMTDVNSKIAAIVDANLHNIESSIEVGTLLKSTEFTALKTKCTADWNQIFDNFNLIENGDTGKKLIMWAMSDLSSTNYMTLIESATNKYTNDTLSENLLQSLLFPEGRMQAFIVDNYQHARVISALNSIATKSENANFDQWITNILSGQQKTELDNFRDAHVGLAMGNIPSINLSN